MLFCHTHFILILRWRLVNAPRREFVCVCVCVGICVVWHGGCFVKLRRVCSSEGVTERDVEIEDLHLTRLRRGLFNELSGAAYGLVMDMSFASFNCRPICANSQESLRAASHNDISCLYLWGPCSLLEVKSATKRNVSHTHSVYIYMSFFPVTHPSHRLPSPSLVCVVHTICLRWPSWPTAFPSPLLFVWAHVAQLSISSVSSIGTGGACSACVSIVIRQRRPPLPCVVLPEFMTTNSLELGRHDCLPLRGVWSSSTRECEFDWLIKSPRKALCFVFFYFVWLIQFDI